MSSACYSLFHYYTLFLSVASEINHKMTFMMTDFDEIR
jgi:hypothetical protein